MSSSSSSSSSSSASSSSIPSCPYAILGVSRSSTIAEIKRAYRTEALKWHPDKNPNNVAEAESRFKAIAEAFSILNDPVKRRDYDLRSSQPSRSPSSPTYSSRPHFTFTNANDLFQQMFADDPFQTSRGMGMGINMSPFGRMGMMDPFGQMGMGMGMGMRDPFMMDPFHTMRNAQSQSQTQTQTQTQASGHAPRVTTTISTHTDAQGRQITTTKTRTHYADGRVQETTSTTTGPGPAVHDDWEQTYQQPRVQQQTRVTSPSISEEDADLQAAILASLADSQPHATSTSTSTSTRTTPSTVQRPPSSSRDPQRTTPSRSIGAL